MYALDEQVSCMQGIVQYRFG